MSDLTFADDPDGNDSAQDQGPTVMDGTMKSLLDMFDKAVEEEMAEAQAFSFFYCFHGMLLLAVYLNRPMLDLPLLVPMGASEDGPRELAPAELEPRRRAKGVCSSGAGASDSGAAAN